ncbi:MAG: hypothetical protein JSW58_02040 [Candidatus Latescibacterota bacterium]|nr:MAG: hypothetical protein JSW58_02040 [Candidatus Latescibacterota bacterium]
MRRFKQTSIPATLSVTVVLAMSAFAIFPACTSQMSHSPHVKASLVEQDYTAALKRIERINKNTSRLLYLYEKGLILHYDNDYEASNSAFEKAEELYDDLYTKSLGREMGSLMMSDNVTKYRGERFEAAMINYYKILNYLYLEEPQGALVECRRLNHRLETFSDDVDSVYVNDPFLQYLTGMVYLAAGELNDADVSLRAALDAYEKLKDRYEVEVPPSIYCDLAECAEARGDLEAASHHRDAAESCGGHDDKEGSGTLNLFIEGGYVSYKVERNAVIPIYKDEFVDDLDKHNLAEGLAHRYGEPIEANRGLHYLLRIAVPEMVSLPEPFMDAGVNVYVDGRARGARAPVVENLDVLAHDAFGARQGSIILKTVFRALTKYLASVTARKKDVIAGWVVNAFGVSTEAADTRSWATLPQTIRMARLVLPEGVYDLRLTLYGRFLEEDESFTIEDVEVVAGRPTFLNLRVY